MCVRLYQNIYFVEFAISSLIFFYHYIFRHDCNMYLNVFKFNYRRRKVNKVMLFGAKQYYMYIRQINKKCYRQIS